MARERGVPARGRRHRPSLVAVNMWLMPYIWWDVPAAAFLVVSVIFFIVAVLLEISLLISPIGAAMLPSVTAATVVLGLLTAYGALAYQGDKQNARESAAPRRIK